MASLGACSTYVLLMWQPQYLDNDIKSMYLVNLKFYRHLTRFRLGVNHKALQHVFVNYVMP